MAVQSIAAPSLQVQLQQPQQQAQDVQSIGVNSSQLQQSQGVQSQAAPKVEENQKSNVQPLDASGAKAIGDEALKKQIQNLNELLKARNTNVTMEYDSLSSPAKVNIIDAESGKIINQIPPNAVVDIATKAKDFIIGLIVDHKA